MPFQRRPYQPRRQVRRRSTRPPPRINIMKFTKFLTVKKTDVAESLIAERIPTMPFTHYRFKYVKVTTAARLWDAAETGANWGIILPRGQTRAPTEGWVVPGAKRATTGKPTVFKKKPLDFAIWKPLNWSGAYIDLDSGLDFYYSDTVGYEVVFCIEFK